MNRVIFLIDGFNIYHSIRQFKRDTSYNTRWLDLSSLCKSYLFLLGKTATIQDIFYFSAIPYYLNNKNPDKIKRHKNYLACLQSTGVKIELGRFKEKTVFCDKCRSHILKHEEKETDVAIGVKAIEIFSQDYCDIAVVVTGDTDLSPAFKKCKEIFPNKKFIFAFPYKRKNKELASLASDSFSINPKQYIKNQFPNPVTLPNGYKIYKPNFW
ncbi:MAG: NYN domain-containing protein [Candidatus Omnitrophota bacterium]